ncbi:MAG: SCO1664 family protein [Dehalococcoidia bacterium]|nr:SCO1664 family protein [Dehalococcoidia bacterium]
MEGVLEVLRAAEFTRLQPVWDSSNQVYVAELAHSEAGRGLGIYKPASGERPLNDFPYGTLHHREVAAYELSALLGWHLVPPTVIREGPRGEGSLQLFIEHDPEEHYFVLREDAALHDQLVRLATFDRVANNADRKGGHILSDPNRRLWAIDNGLTFHQHEKLRTVIWDFAGTEAPPGLLEDLRRALGCIEAGAEDARSLLEPLTSRERGALVERIEAFLRDPVLPEMYPWRCTPWPLI